MCKFHHYLLLKIWMCAKIIQLVVPSSITNSIKSLNPPPFLLFLLIGWFDLTVNRTIWVPSSKLRKAQKSAAQQNCLTKTQNASDIRHHKTATSGIMTRVQHHAGKDSGKVHICWHPNTKADFFQMLVLNMFQLSAQDFLLPPVSVKIVQRILSIVPYCHWKNMLQNSATEHIAIILQCEPNVVSSMDKIIGQGLFLLTRKALISMSLISFRSTGMIYAQTVILFQCSIKDGPLFRNGGHICSWVVYLAFSK